MSETTEKRAPVQSEVHPDHRSENRYRSPWVKPAGTVTWAEHLESFEVYAKRYGREQSAERLAERGGFGYYEMAGFLGHEPTTWRAR